MADGAARELAWMADAANTGEPAAHLWRAPAGLVVPRGYERLPGWATACAASAANGWPVQVRGSGGGLVPQGPGLTNLSVAWRTDNSQPIDTDAVYRDFCALLARALSRLGIEATAQPVQGSFCDGRFNLAVAGRKLAGTAQSWRRLRGRPVALVHAVLIVDADAEALTRVANAFESAAGSDRRYRSSALGSVARAWREAQGGSPPPDLAQQLTGALCAQFETVRQPPTSWEKRNGIA